MKSAARLAALLAFLLVPAVALAQSSAQIPLAAQPAVSIQGVVNMCIDANGKAIDCGFGTLSHAKAPALAASLVAKAAPGTLAGFNCAGIVGTITAGSSYCIAIDATAAPSSGAAIVPIDVCVITDAKGCSLSRIPSNIAMATGITILLSSNVTPYVYTSGVNTGFISADYR